MSTPQKTPRVLVILDGFGHREEREDNAIANANTPVWDRLWSSAPHTLISGSGVDVGLPAGQMGNSEVGHMSLGAGRVIYQNMTRIDKAIETGEFAENPVYCDAVDKAREAGGAVHIFGLLSPGGVHSHERHIAAAVEMARSRGAEEVYVHAFLDGRDTPPRSAQPSLAAVEALFERLGGGRVASIVGRYYAMDRDNRWDRVEQAWQLLTAAQASYRAESAVEALQQAYQRDESDEFVSPTLVTPEGASDVCVQDGDTVLFMNFRADRARQLSHAFLDDHFDHFDRSTRPALSAFVTTTEYASDLQAPVAFPPESLQNVLPEYIAAQGLTQLRLAETEKYAHVTFFFSGGREAEFDGEKRILVASPDVATYDLKPEMSAPEVTDRLEEAIRSGEYDLIVCNYANGDMVGHTGNYAAAVAAVETLDECLGRIEAALLDVGGEALITADHGNCEQMMDHAAGQQHTQHTTELVPLVYIGHRHPTLQSQGGVLADVAPSLLALMGLPKPEEMTGHSLVDL